MELRETNEYTYTHKKTTKGEKIIWIMVMSEKKTQKKKQKKKQNTKQNKQTKQQKTKKKKQNTHKKGGML